LLSEIKLVDLPRLGFSSATTPEYGEIYVRGPNVRLGYYDSDPVAQMYD